MKTTRYAELREWWKNANCNEIVKETMKELAEHYENLGDMRQANIYKYLLSLVK